MLADRSPTLNRPPQVHWMSASQCAFKMLTARCPMVNSTHALLCSFFFLGGGGGFATYNSAPMIDNLHNFR